MKAIVYTQYGPPDVLRLTEVPKPVPNDEEVLVRVRASTVNRTDCAILRAKPFIMRFFLGLLKPNKQIPGTEVAGDIEAVGKSVTEFKAGDKVFAFDDGGLHSYAEYSAISINKALIPMPDGITYEQAAASLEGAHYAYNFINKVDLKSGDKVLVNGASGGIGSATVQLLKYYNANVTGVCDTRNIELIRSLGAGRVIDYTREDFTKDQEQYDFVFDSVGKSSFGKCRHLLKPGGVYISSELGRMAQNLYYSLLCALFGSLPGNNGKKVRFPYPHNIRDSAYLVKKLIAEGKFKSVVDRSYTLAQIADAFRYVEKGHKTGNVVITVSGQNF